MSSEIIFENVSFSYGEKIVFNNLNIRIPLGCNVALVGENGAGKSKLIKLILGLHTPQKGNIFIENKKNSELSAKEKKELFAVAFQDFYRYPLSLRENLSLCLDKSENEGKYAEVLKTVGLVDLVARLDDKIGKYGEHSLELSDGQWQKIALARVLISKAKVLILDEPTASMDPVSESNLYHSFMGIMQSRGTIIITHRMALAKYADVIIVIKDGEVNGIGKHSDLLSQSNYYSMLYKRQSEWYQ